jgi:uncharacterized membrane protein
MTHLNRRDFIRSSAAAGAAALSAGAVTLSPKLLPAALPRETLFQGNRYGHVGENGHQGVASGPRHWL